MQGVLVVAINHYGKSGAVIHVQIFIETVPELSRVPTGQLVGSHDASLLFWLICT